MRRRERIVREHELHLHRGQRRTQATAGAAAERKVFVRSKLPIQEAIRPEGERFGIEILAPMHQVRAGRDIDPCVQMISLDLHGSRQASSLGRG